MLRGSQEEAADFTDDADQQFTLPILPSALIRGQFSLGAASQ